MTEWRKTIPRWVKCTKARRALDCILFLVVVGLLTDGEADRATAKLKKALAKESE